MGHFSLNPPSLHRQHEDWVCQVEEGNCLSLVRISETTSNSHSNVMAIDMSSSDLHATMFLTPVKKKGAHNTPATVLRHIETKSIMNLLSASFAARVLKASKWSPSWRKPKRSASTLPTIQRVVEATLSSKLSPEQLSPNSSGIHDLRIQQRTTLKPPMLFCSCLRLESGF